ncbi:MAG: hypothetical protein BGO31_00250 [Bacteroidetes bacterium 43-16]|uniref:putative peptidoglycan-binding domain-containing protein n=1 Tax=Bacteroidota TaxID=976 RepID=UPI00092C9CB8|nr:MULTISPECIES: putative peptidoglycan-binding domain-containing protein [Bacteroidota]OJV51670.1 MAG: hypothetical protein BGO31_00250 [Bacteroidetes bacterium 43-16]
MKQLIILLAALVCLTSCRNIRGSHQEKIYEIKVPLEVNEPVRELDKDSAMMVADSIVRSRDSLNKVRDSMFFVYKADAEQLAIKNKALQLLIDSMQGTSDTLAARLLHARLMIENARYYLRIANRNTSQQKFLRGWMNRALELQ